jgi:hypothetical protein
VNRPAHIDPAERTLTVSPKGGDIVERSTNVVDIVEDTEAETPSRNGELTGSISENTSRQGRSISSAKVSLKDATAW